MGSESVFDTLDDLPDCAVASPQALYEHALSHPGAVGFVLGG